MNDGPRTSDFIPDLGGNMEELWRAAGASSPILDDSDEGSGRTQPDDQTDQEDNKADTDILEYFRKLRAEVVRRLEIQHFGAIRKYVHDVVHCRDNETAERLCTGISEAAKTFPGKFLIVAQDYFERPHIHIAHDCAYNSSRCRCAFRAYIKKEEGKGRVKLRGALGKRPFIANLRQHWDRIVQYFLSHGKRPTTIRVGNANVPILFGIKSICDRRYKELQERGEMEVHSRACEDDIFAVDKPTAESEEDDGISDTESSPDDNTRNPKRRKRELSKRNTKASFRDIYEEMEVMLRKYPTCPLIAITTSKEWLEHPKLKYMRQDNQMVKNFCDTKMAIINYWTMKEFYEYYTYGNCQPNFGAGYIPIEERYYDMDESIYHLETLLKFQFNNDDDAIRSFLTQLYLILERKNNKCNTIVVKSLPNAGKNFFFDTFLNYLWNYGQLGTMNKTNNFPCQEAPNKRVLLWNEPNYEDYFTDFLKMLLGGDTCHVRVKNKRDVEVYKTPVIVLTNREVGFMKDRDFFTRVVNYEWKPASFLYYCTKKPYPLAAYELLVKWNIME